MRDKTLYTLLHDAETPLEEAPLSRAERARLMNHISRRQHRGKKVLASVCVAAVLMLGFSQLAPGREVFADAVFRLSKLQMSFSEAADGNADLDNYATHIGDSARLGNWDVKLNAVVLDGKDLTVNLLTESADPTKKGDMSENMSNIELRYLSVDGNPVRINGAGGQTGELEEQEGIYNSLITYHLAETLPTSGKVHLTLDFADAASRSLIPEIVRFHVQADAAALAAATRVSEPMLAMDVNNDVVLQSMRVNPYETKLIFVGKQEDVIYSLSGYDDQGRKVVFDTTTSGPEGDKIVTTCTLAGASFGRSIDSHTLYVSSKTLTLQLYKTPLPKESGRMSQEKIPVGEPFTIELPA